LHKKWEGEPLHNRTEREEDRGRRGCSPSEGRRGAQGRRSMVVAGEGRSPARGSRSPESREGDWPLARARAGGLFLKRDMGAPDSAHELFGEPPDSA
jgi:hypothetical protein